MIKQSRWQKMPPNGTAPTISEKCIWVSFRENVFYCFRFLFNFVFASFLSVMLGVATSRCFSFFCSSSWNSFLRKNSFRLTLRFSPLSITKLWPAVSLMCAVRTRTQHHHRHGERTKTPIRITHFIHTHTYIQATR